jgi:membrane protein
MDLDPQPLERDGQTPAARRLRVSLWHLYRVPFFQIVTRTWKSILADRLFGHAAELAFYFLFALFPTLFCAGSLLGLAARSAHQIYDRLLDYLALVIPTSALGAVLTTFNQTAVAATSGKVTFGFLVALWAASVGISAIQDTLNGVYRLRESRSYIMARIDAIILTLLLTAVVTLGLAALFGVDLIARLTVLYFPDRFLALSADIAVRIAGRIIALALLIFSFAVLYTWAPGWRKRRWQWFTPGAAIGIVGWLIASFGLRLYLHYFNSYSLTYGSLGAVIILLTWFYLTGLMILVGAEINSAIEKAAEQAMRPIAEEGSPADESPADDSPTVAAAPAKDAP